MSEPDFGNTPPEEATLVPVTAFKAFYNNYVGIPRTGEMKVTVTVPIDDLQDALALATSRDEILWIEVSKIRYTGPGAQQLADKIEEQNREREELRRNATKGRSPAPMSELDWDT